ncbi:class I SAM-dependent methyltransferase [Roseovarius sp. 2305UL8-3]|uniref:class I SAM-dependent methyltransferase n=1 Tax=Roseovarius conchicola TaxID=3121636 RepID=UPI0035284ED4
MIGRFRFKGDDVAKDIKEKYGFSGKLATLFKNNKGAVVHKWHHYIPIYDKYLSRYRGKSFKMLEIGVSKGGSIQLWRAYFGEDATIYGIDIDPNCAQFDGQYGQVRIGSQDDPDFLRAVIEEMGGVDVIIDDGSHRMDHIRTSLDTLFPLLAEDGIYLVEDLHTAYWPEFGGGPLENMNFFRTIGGMIDDMHKWYHDEQPQVPSTAGYVKAIHIHDSIAVLEKAKIVPPVHSRRGK